MPDDMEILKTLHAIQLDVQSVRARVEHESEIRKQLVDAQQRMIANHEMILLDPDKGLTSRMRTVESMQANQKWAWRVVWGSFLVLLPPALLNTFKNLTKP